MDRPAAMAALPAVAAALALSSCGSDGGGPGEAAKGGTETAPDPALRVEATEGPRGTELVVYVIDEPANSRRTAGGRKTVNLRCFGKGGEAIVSKPHPWPFTDTDEGLTDPHVHQRVPRATAGRVTRCELEGTRGPLRGEVTRSGFE